MVKILFLMVVMIVQFGCSSVSEDKSESKDEAKMEASIVVDPAVIERIEGMGKYLRELKQFEVSSKSTFDIVLENDQKTEFDAKTRYIVQRPDKLFAEIKSERKHRQYFYNGKKFVIYSPKEKFYGEMAHTGPLSVLVKKLIEYGVEVPLSDLFAWGTEEAKSKEIISAMFLNEEVKGKEMKDHFAIRQGKIDWQIWIPKGANPLPEKVLYEINDDTARPKTTSSLKWNLKPRISQTTFEFNPPKNSRKIKLTPARQPTDQ